MSTSGVSHRISVSLGECKVTHENDVLVATGLGSCIGVVAHDRDAKVGGMAHVVLPEGRDADGQSGARFAEPGVRLLLVQMAKAGASVPRLRIDIAGGAAVLTQSDAFNIGLRNIRAVKEAVQNKGLRITAEDTGGNVSRTVELEVETGRCTVRHGDEKRPLGCVGQVFPAPPRSSTILVVDDSNLVRSRCRTILAAYGYEIFEARSAQDAVHIFAQTRPRIVFLDIATHLKGGFRAIAEIRAKDSSDRIIVMTGSEQQAAVISALRMGSCVFLAKPFTPEQLIELASKFSLIRPGLKNLEAGFSSLDPVRSAS